MLIVKIQKYKMQSRANNCVDIIYRTGKIKYNFYSLHDAAMRSFSSYAKNELSLATFGGFACSVISFLVAIIYTVM